MKNSRSLLAIAFFIQAALASELSEEYYSTEDIANGSKFDKHDEKLCHEYGIMQDSNTCDGYFVCANGKKEFFVCPEGTSFLQHYKKCMHYGGAYAYSTQHMWSCKPRDCPHKDGVNENWNRRNIDVCKISTCEFENVFKPRPPLYTWRRPYNNHYCRTYVECKNGRIIDGPLICENGLTYDKNQRKCVPSKENTNPICNTLETDAERLSFLCQTRSFEGRCITPIAKPFHSVECNCRGFLVCPTKSEPRALSGSCPKSWAFHLKDQQCVPTNGVPGCGHFDHGHNSMPYIAHPRCKPLNTTSPHVEEEPLFSNK